MLFVLMLAFQLTGALILMLNCCHGGKKAVIKNCFPGSNVVERDSEDNCIIPKDKLQKSAHTIYLNIAAFGDLVIGYAIAAFSPTATFKTLKTVIGVFVITIIFLAIEYYGSRFIARVRYFKDEKVPYSDLMRNDVETTISGKEIEELFK